MKNTGCQTRDWRRTTFFDVLRIISSGSGEDPQISDLLIIRKDLKREMCAAVLFDLLKV
jgi:hypothetical protein